MPAFCHRNDTARACESCHAPMAAGEIRNCVAKMKWPPCEDGPMEQLPEGTVATALGDLTQSLLESLGVTKERYATLRSELGLEPTCDCDGRREWLNSLGEKAGINNLLTKLSDWRLQKHKEAHAHTNLP